MSAAAYFRVHCGGAVDIPTVEGDAIGQMLLNAAKDVYAAYLIKRPTEHTYLGVPVAHYVANNEEFIRFCNAVLHDPRLKYLFPGYIDAAEMASIQDLVEVSSMIFSVAGGGSSLQLLMLPDAILRSAFAKCSLRGATGLDDYLQETLNTLEDVRELAAGRAVSIPVAIGLTNVTFDGLDELNLPGGMLRKVSSADFAHIPEAAQVEAVLTFQVSFKLLAKKAHPRDEMFPDFSQLFPQVEKWQNSLQDGINKRLLTLMLASPSGHRSAAITVSQSVFVPLSLAPDMSWQERPPATTADRITISSADVGEIQTWMRKVLDQHPKNLGVAMRRIISAVGARIDPVDSLVDAVLAWENMFSGTPETSLRVCGSLAHLLEPEDFSLRQDLFGELGKIYSMRSDIVHGKANEPSTAEVTQQRARAVEIAVMAMRKLYEFPDLLKAENSSVRGKNILLGRVLGSAIDR
ncbi:hypothetical protein SRB17_80500 [Streptomyces sp. RB17]|nr:hypothetical protein [Streptomyces sp. RB17]